MYAHTTMTAHEVAERYRSSLKAGNYPPQVCLQKAQRVARDFGVDWRDVVEWVSLLNDPPKEPAESVHV